MSGAVDPRNQASAAAAERLAIEQVDHWFKYHAPTAEQLPKYEAIREAGRRLATAIVVNAPPSADRTTAIRKIREAVMTANAAIACGGT